MSLPLPAGPAAATPTIRVMIVDDAIVVRGLFTRWLSEEQDLEYVGACRDGQEALDNLARFDPDVIVLDISMPGMDGLTALPLLLARKPGVAVIIVSTVTRRNAEISLKALELGAADYVPKPETSREILTAQEFRREVVEKIRQLGRRGRGREQKPRRRVLRDLSTPGEPAVGGFKLRNFSAVPPRVLVIGSSTGGPQALNALMADLSPQLERLPVLIAQHMPPTFTTILAEHVGRTARRAAREAVDGERLAPGIIYVAPGGRHMRLLRDGKAVKVMIDDGPPVNFCKPAADPLFASAAATFGAGTLALVLTGMGVDGLDGAARVAAAGGSVIAQDEASSVIWGMPGAVAEAGLCAAVLPLGEIGPRIVKLLAGGAR